MSDLVEVLRLRGGSLEKEAAYLIELLRNEALNGLGCPALYSEAADEIERLRAEVAEHRDRTTEAVRQMLVTSEAYAKGCEAAARSMRERAVAECQYYVVGIDKAVKYQLDLTADMIAILPLIEGPKP